MSTRTILGPLTTTYTPAPSCTVLIQQCSTCVNAWQDQSCFASATGSVTNYGVQDRPECWPPRTTGAPTPVPPLEGWGFYSPGIACPAGHTSACVATAGGSSGWPVQFAMTAGETAVGCCPSGYFCVNGGAQTCQSLASSTTLPLVQCVSGTTGAFSYYTIPLTAGTATISTYSFYAPMIQINFQSSDLPATSSTSATSSSTSTTVASNTSSPSPSHTSSPSSGLSSGAKIGIGVGIALGAVALIAAGLLMWRRRQRYSQAALHSPGPFELNDGKGYHPNHPTQPTQPLAELGQGNHNGRVAELQ